jgi:hypothetical protein
MDIFNEGVMERDCVGGVDDKGLLRRQESQVAESDLEGALHIDATIGRGLKMRCGRSETVSDETRSRTEDSKREGADPVDATAHAQTPPTTRHSLRLSDHQSLHRTRRRRVARLARHPSNAERGSANRVVKDDQAQAVPRVPEWR